MVSDYALKMVDWWQDLGDGIVATYSTKFTKRPSWHVSIHFRDAMKLGGAPGGDNDFVVYEDSPDFVYLPNGHTRFAKHKDRLSGVTRLLYDRLMEAVG